MEKINKKISVILPAYNAEKTLDRCFRSLDEQKYKPDEIVVVDDASEDNTKKIIYLWKESLPLKYFKNNNNMGLPLSLNRAIKESKGELLIRIDSDDEWKSNHIEEIINLYKKNDAVLFSTRSQYISEDSKPISSTKILSNDSVRKLLMWDNPFVHSAIAFKKSDYVLTSGYPLDNYAQDYSLFIELLNKGELVASDKITVNYFEIQALFQGKILMLQNMQDLNINFSQ